MAILVLVGCAHSAPPRRAPQPPAPAAEPATEQPNTPVESQAVPESAPVPASAPAPKSSPPIQPLSPDKTRTQLSAACLPPGDPKLAAASTKVAKVARANLDAELARRGLTWIALPRTIEELHRGLRHQGPGTKVKPRPSYIMGDRYWTGGINGTGPGKFARDSKGQIFWIEEQPVAGPTTVAKVCGCTKPTCPEQGSPCPGCHSTVQEWYGPLPPGTTYAGPLSVPYQRPSFVTEQPTCGHSSGRAAASSCPNRRAGSRR